MFHFLKELLFPSRCILCRKLLKKDETDLCHPCRSTQEAFSCGKIHFPFVARWSALWYYKGDVRGSILRYKFGNRQSYASAYGRLLAMKLSREFPEFDILTWVPISAKRRRKRGFDQVELIAQAVARELGCDAVPALLRIRDSVPQSSLRTAAQRRANVLGAYIPVDPEFLSGKTVLLLDDVITTGATVSECARTLLTAGAQKVLCAAVACASFQKK